MSWLRSIACEFIGAAGAFFLLVLPDVAAAQVHRELHFQNRCRYPIRLIVHHQHDDGNLATHGWYSVAGKVDMTRLESASGQPLVHTEGRDLYFYAEVTTPGINYYWQGETPVIHNGIEYQLMRSALRVQDGKLYLWTHCDNLPG